ncbi:methylaspartate mutase subunit E [Paenibacillus athensensis]|uniref:Glutamate mutase epsilon subunit n=1 Tax=Paenibacillus athensensis TaxID=1967502 RepID=A0A4Y8Q7C3_9BACL|nr:methylaspartate mutase subunit E [Paenibacillus athensensis]MCD1257294.1 methylaspartate mutase subunit E [Paenibacillus athensensis]
MLRNRKWSEAEFRAKRDEVLRTWPTGAGVDLDEAVAYVKRLPAAKSFHRKLADAAADGRSLVQPRGGVGVLGEHIKLLRHLQDAGQADLLPTTIDSYTRQNRYAEGETGIRESEAAGRSLLNGFPAVNYGVAGCRRVQEAVAIPVEARHGTPDARLLSEIVYASGWTSNEGGGISYNIPYAKSVPLERSLLDWQYCDRLTGLYEEMGIRLNREPYGPLTGTLVPPCVSNAVAILEALLAAEQGVKCLTLGYGQCGNLLQDVAALRALKEQAAAYLATYGYSDVHLTTVFHQWMGGFPTDELQATSLILWGTVTASLAGATKIIVKTTQEALGVPTMEANAQATRLTKEMATLTRGQRLPASPALEQEVRLIKEETDCLLAKVLELGEGDWAVGTVRAFAAGTLDIPFAPSRYNAGRILPARDNDGAIRLLDCGQLPLSPAIRSFHRDKLEQRARHEKRSVQFQMVVDDIYAVSRGALIGRPLQEQFSNL